MACAGTIRAPRAFYVIVSLVFLRAGFSQLIRPPISGTGSENHGTAPDNRVRFFSLRDLWSLKTVALSDEEARTF